MTKTRWSSVAITAALAVAAVGCSDGAGRFSPIGPSPLAATPAPTTTATAANWATAHGWSTMADGRVAVADGVVVEGVDVIGAVSGACPAVTISVRGVPVAVTAMTTFSAPLTCASLASGQSVRVSGVLVPMGAGFSVTATHLAAVGPVENKAPAPSRGGERMSGEGVVGAVGGSCPSLTFFIMGHRVHTTPSTVYVNGACETLHENAHVKLDVEKQADGIIVAEKVEFLRAR